MADTDEPNEQGSPDGEDRRRPTVEALVQPVAPVGLHAQLGTRDLLERAEVVSLTDRTIVVEVADAALALAFTVAPRVTVVVDLGGGEQTLVATPGRRSSDNPTSRRVELVLRDRD